MALQLKTPWWPAKLAPLPRVTIGLISAGTVSSIANGPQAGSGVIDWPHGGYTSFPSGGNWPNANDYKALPSTADSYTRWP